MVALNPSSNFHDYNSVRPIVSSTAAVNAANRIAKDYSSGIISASNAFRKCVKSNLNAARDRLIRRVGGIKLSRLSTV